jgi:asparagine synthase (glutamine-hydrolysing)
MQAPPSQDPPSQDPPFQDPPPASHPLAPAAAAGDSIPTSGLPPGISMVADVRLDNRDELAHALGLPSRELASLSDRTLLLEAWLRWREDCLDRLSGAFAFACWDPQTRRLFLARDHSGERPLFFSRQAGFFAFASMPKGLRGLPQIGSRLDVVRMADFLAIVTPQGTDTFFAGIERLLPGHAMTVNAEEVRIRRYWHPLDAKPIRYRRNDEYLADFHERFDRAVGARLHSSRPLTAQLSGGLDSSSVAATAARLLAESARPLTCFTAVPLPNFDGGALFGRFGDEGPAAAEVAAMYPNIDHRLVSTEGEDLFHSIERGNHLTDQPVFNPTNQMWVDAILDGVRAQGSRVLLQGVCGNATISFGGLVGLADLFRGGRWVTLARQIRELRAKGHTSWRGGASWAMGGLAPQWLRGWMHPEMRNFSFSFSPIHPDRAEEYHLRDRVLEEFYGSDSSSASMRRKLYDYYDPGQINAAAAHGWGIENRDPTQDRRIFEFCFAIPIEQYLAEGQSRSLIRRAMRGRLPESTLARTTRGLQAADWYLVMGRAHAQMQEALHSIETSPLARHLLDLPRLQHLLDTWPAASPGTLPSDQRTAVNDTYHLALSRGLAAGLFIKNFG